MTPEQVNRAIAEECGWTKCACDDPHCDAWFPPDGEPELSCPNYHDSLDACAEFERILDDADQVEYCLRLNEVIRRQMSVGDGLHTFQNITATAPQRCEAFLRLKGKWE